MRDDTTLYVPTYIIDFNRIKVNYSLNEYKVLIYDSNYFNYLWFSIYLSVLI